MNYRKRIVSLLLCLVLVLSIGLTACTTNNAGDNLANEPDKTNNDTSNKSNEVETLEISWFEGGSGRDYVDFAIEKFKEKYPDVKIITDIGPKNAETLRPRFVAGNPPDVIMANYSELDYFALIADDQLAPIDEVLASPVPGNESKTLEDLFVPEYLTEVKATGKDISYLVLFTITVLVWQGSFDENGWSAPNNYDELMSVSQQIQAGEVSPLHIKDYILPTYLEQCFSFGCFTWGELKL